MTKLIFHKLVWILVLRSLRMLPPWQAALKWSPSTSCASSSSVFAMHSNIFSQCNREIHGASSQKLGGNMSWRPCLFTHVENGHQATFESQLQSAWTLLRAIRRNTSQHLSKGNWDAARKCWQPPFPSPWWFFPYHQHSLPLSTAQPLVAEVHTIGTRSNAFVLNFFLPRRGFRATEGLSHVPCWSEGKSWSQQVHSHINDMNHSNKMKHHKLL